MERDKKWTRVADLARTSMRLSAYTGAITNLLAQANELRVSLEDRQTLHEVLLALSEAMWSQQSCQVVRIYCISYGNPFINTEVRIPVIKYGNMKIQTCVYIAATVANILHALC